MAVACKTQQSSRELLHPTDLLSPLRMSADSRPEKRRRRSDGDEDVHNTSHHSTTNDDDIVIPDDFQGDPDEYIEEYYARKAAATRADAVLIQVCNVDDAGHLGKGSDFNANSSAENVVYPFYTEKRGSNSLFSHLTRANVHCVFDYLDIPDLARLSTVNSTFQRELDDDNFWAARYILDLGFESYQKALVVHNDNGWTIRQSLVWSMLSLLTSEIPDEDVKWKLLQSVWAGILCERRRKTKEKMDKLQRARRVDEEEKAEKEKTLKEERRDSKES